MDFYKYIKTIICITSIRVNQPQPLPCQIVNSEVLLNFKLYLYSICIAKPSDIFVSIQAVLCVLIRFTPVKAPRHNPKYSVIRFLQRADHAAWIRYPNENKVELTYPESPLRIRTFLLCKNFNSPSLNCCLERNGRHDELTPTFLRLDFFPLSPLLFDMSHRYSWIGRVVKSNKTPFLYLVFRQYSRNDNKTCRPADTVCIGPDIADHSQKTPHTLSLRLVRTE